MPETERAYGQPELNINKTLPPGVKMATLWYFMGFRMMFPGRLTQGEGKRTQGWSSAWRHTLVIMALGRPKHEDQLKSKIQNQPSPHSEFKGMLVNTVTCLRGLKKKKKAIKLIHLTAWRSSCSLQHNSHYYPHSVDRGLLDWSNTEPSDTAISARLTRCTNSHHPALTAWC